MEQVVLQAERAGEISVNKFGKRKIFIPQNSRLYINHQKKSNF
jgi:hypothetical protein